MMCEIAKVSREDFERAVAEHTDRYPLCGALVGYPLICSPDGQVWPEPKAGVTVLMDGSGLMYFLDQAA